MMASPVCSASRRLVLCAAVAAACMPDSFAQSPPVTADYAVVVSEQYTDNHVFGGQSTFITRVAPSVVLRRDTEVSKVGIQGIVFANSYSNSRAAKDSVGYRLGFDSTFIRDRNTFGLEADLVRDSRFSTVPGSPDFQLASTQRTALSLEPTFVRSITERLSINASGAYISTTFDQNTSGTLFDFTNRRISGGLQYRVTELDSIGATVSSSRYRTDPDTTSSDSTSLQANWNRRWTETLDTTVAVGRTQTTTRTQRNAVICSSPNIIDCILQPSLLVTVPVGRETDTSTPTWNVTGTYRFTERTGLAARYGKDILPSAGGAVTSRELITVSLSHQLSERMRGSANYQRSESEFSGLPGVTSNASIFESISLRMSYNLASDWSLDGALTRSESTIRSGSRVAHGVFVSIRKDWRNNRIWP